MRNSPRLPPANDTFDDHLWPVNLLLMITGGVLLGVTLAYCKFDEPRVFYNAWTYVGGVPALVLLAMFVVRFIGNRIARRTMQFAVIASFLIHLVMFLAGLRTYIFSGSASEVTFADITKSLALPEPKFFQFSSSEYKQQDFDRPIPTANPELAPEKVNRQSTDEGPTHKEREETPPPESTPTTAAKSLAREQFPESSPTLTDPQLTRQSAQPKPLPELIKPVETPRPEPDRAKMEAEAAALARRSTPADVQRTPAEQDPAVTPNQELASLLRKPLAERGKPEATVTPAARRLPKSVAPLPPVEAALASKQPDRPAEKVEAKTGEFAKQTTANAVAAADLNPAESNLETTSAAQPVAVRRETTESRPTTNPATAPHKRPRPLDLAVAPVADNVPPPPTPKPTPPQYEPVASKTVKQAADSAQAARANVEPTVEALNATAVANASRRDSSLTGPVPSSATSSRANRPAPANLSAAAANVAQSPEKTEPVAAVQPKPETIQRTATADTPSPKGVVAEIPTATSTAPTAQVARQPAREPAIVASSDSPSRRSTTPSANVATTAQSQDAPANPPPVPTTIAAVTASTNKQTIETANVTQSIADPKTETLAPAVAQTARRSPVAEPSNLAAALSDAKANRRPTTIALRPETPVELAAKPRVESPAATPQPIATAVARQSDGRPSQESPATRDEAAATVATPVVQAKALRVGTSMDASVGSSPSPRATRAATNAVSSAAETLASAPAIETARESTLVPASVAFSKSDQRSVPGEKTSSLDVPSPDASQAARDGNLARADKAPATDPASAAAATSRASRPREGIDAAQSAIAALSLATAAPGAPALQGNLATIAKATSPTASEIATKAGAELEVGPRHEAADASKSRVKSPQQPAPQFASQASELARGLSAGAPQLALAAAAVAPQAKADPVVAVQPAPTAVTRSDPGQAAPFAGEAREPGEVAAGIASQSSVARAETAPDSPQASGGTPDDEEEKRRRLARSKQAGVQTVALAGPVELAVVPAGTAAANTANSKSENEPNSTAVAKSVTVNVQPVAGGAVAAALPSPAPEATDAPQLASAAMSRNVRADLASAVPTTVSGRPESPSQVASQTSRTARDKSPRYFLVGQPISFVTGGPRRPLPGDTIGAPLATPAAEVADVSRSVSPGTADSSNFSPPTVDIAVASASGSASLATVVPTRAVAESRKSDQPADGDGPSSSRAVSSPVAAVSGVAVSVGPVKSGDSQPALEPRSMPTRRVAATAVAVAKEPVAVEIAVADAPRTASQTRHVTVSSAMGEAGTTASPSKKSARLANRTATRAGSVEVPKSDISLADAAMGKIAEDMLANSNTMSRQPTGTLAVKLETSDGPGGLASHYVATANLNARRSTRDATPGTRASASFIRHLSPGVPSLQTEVVVSTDAFKRKGRRDLADEGSGPGKPGPKTEASVELGLTFLSRYQNPDGSWSLGSFPGEQVGLASDTAATALCLMAFQGAGYNHREFKYAETVRKAIDYLLKHQKNDGDLFRPLDDESNRSVWLYSHAIAALALCESYGMTQDPRLRGPAQRALDFIVAGQNADLGGWRYIPQQSSDTSVTGWMMMALKSGELANLRVPPETYERIGHWLDISQGSAADSHLYRYNPRAPDTPTQRHGREPSLTMTSVGLLMRLYTGWRRDNPKLVQGAEYLRKRLPKMASAQDRDTYYWYYATQVMFHMQGEYWKEWEDALHPMLIRTQEKDHPDLAGSWDPKNPVPDRWSEHAGRLYVTTMNLLSLEIKYRHLPLYEDTRK